MRRRGPAEAVAWRRELVEAVAEVTAEGSQEGLSVGDGGKLAGAVPRSEGAREVEGRRAASRVRLGAQARRRTARSMITPPNVAARLVSCRRHSWMFFQQNRMIVLLQDRLDLRVAEPPADGAAMFVEYDARWLVQDLPATFPGQIAEVRVLKVERSEDFVEASQFEEFVAIERARSTPAVEARKECRDAVVNAVGDPQPPSSHQPCVSPVSTRFFAGSERKIWHATANTFSSVKPSSSGCRNPGSTRISLFSKTTMSLRAARKPALDPPPNPRFLGRPSNRTCGNAFWRYSALPSVGAVVDNNNLVRGVPFEGGDY